MVGDVRPALTLPPPGPSPNCLCSPIHGNSLHPSFLPVPGAVASSWVHLGLAWAPGCLPMTPHLVRKQLVALAILLTLSRLPRPCPCDSGQGPGPTQS